MSRNRLSDVLMITIAASGLGLAQETSIKKEAVPSSVLEAFRKSYPSATIRGYSKESKEGKTEYEIESVEGKIHRDVTFASDGSLVSVEESIRFGDSGFFSNSARSIRPSMSLLVRIQLLTS